VQKPPRTVTISALAVMDISLPRVRFRVTCSPGTYIRTLGADIGRSLGCGAHVTALRRTASSGFSLTDAVPLAALESAARNGEAARYIRPLSAVMQDTPALVADAQLMADIRHGRPVHKSSADAVASGSGGPIRVMAPDGQLVAVLLDTTDATHFAYGCVLTG